MLPTRKSAPAPRRAHAIAVEVRVPSEGTWFAALAAKVRPDGLSIQTFRELDAGTAVVVELALPSGPLVLDGFVEEHDADGGPWVRVSFDDLAEEVSAKLAAVARDDDAEVAARVA